MARPTWTEVLERCARDDCSLAATFLQSQCSDRSFCSPRGRGGKRAHAYRWIEEIIKNGVPDGRSRLILYVISRYLINIKSMDIEEAEAEIDEFIKASCRNHGNCGKIYKSWIRNVLKHVQRGGWRPWSLDRMKRDDPDLYKIVISVIDSGGTSNGKEEE